MKLNDWEMQREYELRSELMREDWENPYRRRNRIASLDDDDYGFDDDIMFDYEKNLLTCQHYYK